MINLNRQRFIDALELKPETEIHLTNSFLCCLYVNCIIIAFLNFVYFFRLVVQKMHQYIPGRDGNVQFGESPS